MKAILKLNIILIILSSTMSYCDKKPTLSDKMSYPVTIQTVKIGNQWWMAENLKVTHYQNGDPIVNKTLHWDATTGAYCAYDNDEKNADTYGYLYNGYAVIDSRNIAPEGWHVPTDAEWHTLIDYLGSSAGGKLKEAGTVHWDDPNTGATNESGFTAIPSGIRTSWGQFCEIGNEAYFWSATENENGALHYLRLDYNYHGIDLGHIIPEFGLSVRLIRD
jgi:uncharacterized protein (TIGR02145 family)